MKNKKDLVQLQNPRDKKWVLINIEKGILISRKKTPYKNVKIVREVK